jgi:hypothetical protein
LISWNWNSGSTLTFARIEFLAVPVTIRWITQPELSVAHAAYIVATGAPCVDPKTEALMIEAVTAINTRLISSSLDVREFWQTYRSQMAMNREGSKACSAALLAAGCSEFQLEQTAKAITSRLSEGRMEFHRRFPKLGEQLELRGRPLKERWDTVGAGLLVDVQRQVWGDSPPDRWWPAKTEGLLVQPMRGGDGGCEPSAARIWVEAMLTDADPQVPEVLRVAWLITCLAIDNHLAAASPMLIQAWSLAAVPLVLTAGRQLEVIRGDTLPVQSATQLWQLGGEMVGDKVDFWWHENRSSQSPLPVAVKELEHLLRTVSPDDPFDTAS